MSSTCKTALLVLIYLSISVTCKEITRNVNHDPKEKTFQKIDYVSRLEENKSDKVVITMPVLAPLKNSRVNVIETAKDFPSLTVLETDNTEEGIGTDLNDTKNKDTVDQHPIYYVKKLDEKYQYNRQRRRILASLPSRP